MTRTPARRRTRMLLGTVFAGALLGLAEVTARIAGVTPAYRPDSMGQWRMMSDLSDHRMTGMREPHSFSITTNSDGFRTDASLTAREGTVRIAVMGDSTVFGWGVEDNEGIAEVAQASLRSAGHDTVEVLNFGQPGYSTGMAGWLFEEAVAAYRPDLTIVFVSMHDFNKTLISDVERVHGAATFTASARSFLVQNVALYEALRRRIYPLADKAQILPHESSSEARVERVSETERTMVLNRMTAVAADWGGAVSIGFLPFYADLQPGNPSGQVRPGLAAGRAWSEARERPLFDLRSCCAFGADERTFPFDHGHLNARGNREVGAALAEAIQTHLLPRPVNNDGG